MSSYCKTPSRPKSACRFNRGSKLKTSFRKIVDHYKNEIRPSARKELRFFTEQPDPKSAIHAAAMCEYPPGRRHDHQTRIPRDVLNRSYRKLKRLDYSIFQDFDSLHSAVQEAIGPIHGIGPLTVYDIGHRIGSYVGLEPRRVYLHAGTKDGVCTLGLDYRKPSLDIKDLPKEFRQLRPYEVVDCLCIYKSDFEEILDS